jgi:hypothetical protein
VAVPAMLGVAVMLARWAIAPGEGTGVCGLGDVVAGPYIRTPVC